MKDTSRTSRWAFFRARSLALRTRQAVPHDQATDIAPSSSKASRTAEKGNAAYEPAAPPAESIPTDAANPELAQVVLAKAAHLARQPGFQANTTHLDLPYRVHRIMAASGPGELGIPRGVDRDAVRRFVDEVFFATQFLDEDVHLAAKARAARQRPATGVLVASEDPDSGQPGGSPNSVHVDGLLNIGSPPGDAADQDVEDRHIADELESFTRPAQSKASKTLPSTRTWSIALAPVFTVRAGTVCGQARV
jgi:hypothetical protein